VHQERNPRYHALLKAFKGAMGHPVLVNGNLNAVNTIVCTREDAFHCFMGTGIEAMAIGDCFYVKKFELD
jgi:carbamoyltransferase